MLYPRGAERNVGLLKGDWVIRIEESEELVVPQQLSFIFFLFERGYWAVAQQRRGNSS